MWTRKQNLDSGRETREDVWRCHGHDGVIGISASEIGSFIVVGERVPDVLCAGLGSSWLRLSLAHADLFLMYSVLL